MNKEKSDWQECSTGSETANCSPAMRVMARVNAVESSTAPDFLVPSLHGGRLGWGRSNEPAATFSDRPHLSSPVGGGTHTEASSLDSTAWMTRAAAGKNRGGQWLTGLLLMLVPLVVTAEPVSKVAWTPETLRFVKQADAKAGADKAELCESCHGTLPGGVESTRPNLRGQLATYLYKQLQDYKTGVRANDVMQGVTETLKDQDMADIAAFYAAEPVPAKAASASVPEHIEQLVNDGDPKRILTPCKVCHGGSGQGQPLDNPALAGQPASYLEQTLLAYKSGARKNDNFGRMRTLAARLSDEEIKGLAGYFAGLKP